MSLAILVDVEDIFQHTPWFVPVGGVDIGDGVTKRFSVIDLHVHRWSTALLPPVFANLSNQLHRRWTKIWHDGEAPALDHTSSLFSPLKFEMSDSACRRF